MSVIRKGRILPDCLSNPDESGKHDFKKEIEDFQSRKVMGKREKWLWKKGWKRCWWCTIWVNWKEYLFTKKQRKKAKLKSKSKTKGVIVLKRRKFRH